MTNNPTERNDDFICDFVNLATFVNGIIWQISRQVTNGYNCHIYYIYCGKLPDPTIKNEMNYSLNVLMALSTVVFIFVRVKIKLYKKKVDTHPVHQTSHAKPLPSLLGLVLKTSMASLATVAIGLLIAIPSTILVLRLVKFP